jgi:hypothetical protein
MPLRPNRDIHLPHGQLHRYGPYFVHQGFQCCVDFGGARSFELLVAAFCDPHVTPEQAHFRGMRNGIAIVFHDLEHESLVLDGSLSAERIRPQGPTEEQIRAYHRIKQMTWEEFVTFCVSSPVTYVGWRDGSRWERLVTPLLEVGRPGTMTSSSIEHAVR